MDRAEIADFIGNMSGFYVKYFQNVSKQQGHLMVTNWLRVLGRFSKEQVEQALDIFVCNDTQGYPPVPGQLIKIIRQMQPSPYPSAEEAWQQARASVSYSDYHEAFNSLPEITQKVLGTPSHLDELRHMNTDTLEKSEKPRFIRKYEELSEKNVMIENAGIKLDPPKTERLETTKEPAATDGEGNAKYSPRGKYLTGLEVREYAKAVGYAEGSADTFYLFCFSHGIDKNPEFVKNWKECYMAFYDGDKGWLQSYQGTKKDDATSAECTVTRNAIT